MADVPAPSVAFERPQGLLARCPTANVTPLHTADGLAQQLGIGALWIKDERTRMGLGSFKALGASYVIACDHELGQARGQTYVTASAGNHGLSVAAGAAAFGAHAVIFLSNTVPEGFADRLRKIGAEVKRAGDTYEASMEAAADFASDNNAILLSDSSWPGYLERPYRLMEGYTAFMAETIEQVPDIPTHIFLQAGVGGLAGAAAAMARKAWGEVPFITVVEPDAAPALIESIRAGEPVITKGPVSEMGRLDCKEPSLIALKGLARDANAFMTVSEMQGRDAADLSARRGFASTSSGTAGLAGLIAARDTLQLGSDTRALIILSEEAEA